MSTSTEVLTAEEGSRLKLVAILDIDHTRLEASRQEWQSILEAYRDLPCSTLEEEDQWADWLNAAHAVVKAAEAERLSKTGPINAELKATAAAYNESVAPAVAFKALAAEKLAAAKHARKLAEEAARAAAQLAAQAGDSEGVYAALATVGAANEKISGTTGRTVVTVEVVDINLVDRALLILDEKKALALYKLTGGQPVPGLKFTTTTKVQPTGRAK
jgi:hypothetical protein